MAFSFTLDGPLPPDVFHGRENTIKQISERLADNERHSTCLAGGPKTGKTSLLRFLGYSPAASNLAGLAGACTVFYQGESVGTAMTPAQFWTGVLKDLLPKVPTLDAILTAKIDKARKGQVDIYDLEDVFDACAQAAKPVVLLIDDFDYLLKNANFWPPHDFFHHVRSLGQRYPRGLSFVITTPRPLIDLWDPNKGASPFYNIFENVSVGVLSESEIRTLVRDVFSAMKVDLPQDVEDVIVDASDGHPRLANYVGFICAQALLAGSAVTAELLEKAFTNPNGEVVALIAQIQARLLPGEKELLKSLALNSAMITDSQRDALRKLRAYGLLPPGVKL